MPRAAGRRMPDLPQPPAMRRRLERPLQGLGLIVLFAAVPAVIVALASDVRARASVLQVAACFVTLMIAFRVIGKRELGRLSPFELVMLMLIPEILSSTVQGEESLLQGLAGLSTVLVLVLMTSLLSQRFSALQRVIEPEPTVLVSGGRLLEHAMNQERIAPDELFSEMRKQGIAALEEVRFAVLEPSGNITFIRHGGPQDSQRPTDLETGPAGN